MTFTLYQGTPNCTGCIIIKFDGESTDTTVSNFDIFIDENAKKLNLSGGSIVNGLTIGKKYVSKDLTHISQKQNAVIQGIHYLMESAHRLSLMHFWVENSEV
jgi:hypothetical protein